MSTSNPLKTLAKRLVGLPTDSPNCCSPMAEVPITSIDVADPNRVHQSVREHYGQIARTHDTSLESCCGGDSCGCNTTLYPREQLETLPAAVTGLSLGCGDPVTLADIRTGDTVLDLGSGGGIDCFLAAKRVGPTGRVIGVDMTADMLARARVNAEKMKAVNVEFRQGQIEALPVENDSVDVVISNCVINLSPDKLQVFREMFRALKRGGRVSVSDIVTNGPMSPAVLDTHGPERAGQGVARGIASWVGCVAGAMDVSDYRAGLEAAGFVGVVATPKQGQDMLGLASPVLAALPIGLPFSAIITARKPDDE